MKPSHWHGAYKVAVAMVLAVLGSTTASAASSAPCEVSVDSPESATATVVITPAPAQEWSGVHLSSAGIGSLYWAARHPSEAWRVLLPIEPGHAPAGHDFMWRASL